MTERRATYTIAPLHLPPRTPEQAIRLRAHKMRILAQRLLNQALELERPLRERPLEPTLPPSE